MKLTLAEPKYLKESISIISDLVNEARFKITPSAIELVAMDPANVAMVIFKLLSSCFVEYDVKTEENIAINLSNLKQILKRAGPNDLLTLELENNMLKVTIKGRATRTFNISTLEFEEKEQKIPELHFSVNVKMPCSAFNESIEDVDIIADSVVMAAEPNRFTLIAEGENLSNAKIELESDDEYQIKTDGQNPVKAKYSIEYLKKMIAGSKLSDSVEVSFNKDYPLKLEYKAVDKVHLAFILAPRVENY